MIETLAKQLGDGPYGEPPAVVIDESRQGCWQTAKRAWELSDPDKSDWHLIIQEDALPCADFWSSVHAALSALPKEAQVASFFGRYQQRGKHDIVVSDRLKRGLRWVKFDCCDTGVCVAMRTSVIADMIKWGVEHVHDRCVVDDYHYSMWMKERGIDGWFTIPSLVDHIGDQSILFTGIPLPVRRASYFIGADQSGAGFDWTAGIGDAPRFVLHHEARYAEFRK